MLNPTEVEAHARRCAESAEIAAQSAKVQSLRISLELAKETGRFTEEQTRQFGKELEDASGVKFMPPPPLTPMLLRNAVIAEDDVSTTSETAWEYKLVTENEEYVTKATINHTTREIRLT